MRANRVDPPSCAGDESGKQLRIPLRDPLSHTMKTPTKDLFDDSTMTFGEHLEALRVHLIRALLGLILAATVCLYKGDAIVDFIRRPIDRALKNQSVQVADDLTDVKSGAKTYFSGWMEALGFSGAVSTITGPSAKQLEWEKEKQEHPEAITVTLDARELLQALGKLQPGQPAPAEIPEGTPLQLKIKAPEFQQFQRVVDQSHQAVTLKVEEAFMTYMKVSLIAAAVLASPWIFYQLWQFVAAGLYPHEQRYVHIYGLMSLGLFLSGAAFCFYAVFPFVLKFLMDFNAYLGVTLQPRLSEWISFAVILPLMFGISFQLPLVMLFLERITVFRVEQYTEQRRMAILVIAILSAVLTPADPMSMLMMMFPLIFLYELGILLCKWLPVESPFAET